MGSKDKSATFDWFGNAKGQGVYVVKFEGNGLQPHAVDIGWIRGRVYDSSQLTVLRLPVGLLRLFASSGGISTSIITAREVRPY